MSTTSKHQFQTGVEQEEHLSLLEDYWKYVLVYVTLHKVSTLFCMAKAAIVSILICRLIYHICKSLGFVSFFTFNSPWFVSFFTFNSESLETVLYHGILFMVMDAYILKCC